MSTEAAESMAADWSQDGDLSHLTDRQLLEAIAHWQRDANRLISGLMQSVKEVRENPAVLFQGMLGG